MTRPTARVLVLLDILQSGGTRTVAELAELLGVNERTVRRYVEHLLDLDVPVESLRGRYGGYRIAPGHRMPPLMLTDDEALATLLGLVAGQQAGLATALPAATDAAAAKIRRVLPQALGHKLDALLNTTTFTARTTPAISPETRVLLSLAEATRDRHPVTISYADRTGARSERTIQPYGLVAHSGRWYVAAADSSSDEIRTFRLDRITHPRALPGSFTPPAGFDAAEHILSGLARAPWAHDVSLQIRGSIDQIRRRLPEGLATVEALEAQPSRAEDDGESPATDAWFRVQFRVQDLGWVPATLSALDCPFTIERPEELRALVTAHARRLAGYAANGANADHRPLPIA